MTSVAEDLIEQGRQEGWQKGKQEGRQEGRQEGKREGEKQEKREIAKKMLTENSAPVFVMKVTGLSFVEVQVLQKECGEGSAVNESPA